jgi:transposase
VDPLVFFKLQLVMIFEGIRSKRQLQQLAADRLSLRWYLGYNLDESLPDHSSLTRHYARPMRPMAHAAREPFDLLLLLLSIMA